MIPIFFLIQTLFLRNLSTKFDSKHYFVQFKIIHLSEWRFPLVKMRHMGESVSSGHPNSKKKVETDYYDAQ